MANPGRALPALVRVPQAPGDEQTMDWRRLIPAWIVSGVIHVVLLSLFLLVTVTGSAAPANHEFTNFVSPIEEDAKNPNFSNPDEGTDPDSELNFAVNNIKDVSTPGLVAENMQAGIQGGADNLPPVNISAPLGFNPGTGGGIDHPTLNGVGNRLGTPGGQIGGVKLPPGGIPLGGGATRQMLLQVNGGNTRSEAAVTRGLAWLARHQRLNGSWGFHDFHVAGKCSCKGAGIPGRDVAATSLALMTFLAIGENQKGYGSAKQYTKQVERGLHYLISQQGVDGSFGDGYTHAMATLVLCDALNITNDPLLRGPADRAVRCIVNWQAGNGGWRYRPREDGDLSVSGWHLQALKSGHMAGLAVPAETWAGMSKFLDANSTPDGGNLRYLSTHPYTPRMTSVGLLSRLYLGWGPRNPGIAKGVDSLQKLPPSANYKDIYYYYYATQVVYHGGSAEAWDGWNSKMRDLLIDTQDKGDNPQLADQRGSWSPEGDQYGPQLGRLGVTALSLLTLEVYYRRLPLYQRQLGAMKDEQILNR